MDGQNVVAVQPIALIDGRQIAMVDFATGRVELGKVDGSQGAADLVRCGDVLCMMGEGKLVAACSLPDFKPLSVHKGGFWRVADGVEYYVNGPRVAAWDMATGEPLWQSRAFTWRTRLLVVAGKTLLAAQDLEDKHDPRARVIAIDRANGDVLAEVEALGLNFHDLGHKGEDLYASDLGYLYRFGSPREPTRQRIRVRQERGDVEAIAAVRLARDMEAGLLDPPPAGEFTPVIDADLSDWQEAEWMSLKWPGDWQPDHVLLSSRRPRRPTGIDDLSAAVALAQDERFVYLAARVHDATHDAAVGRPLWRGDSVHVAWRAGNGQAAEALAMTAALVDDVPCLELGEISHPMRAMPDTGFWPDWLKLAVWEKAVPWLRRRQNGAMRVPDVRLAARRDEATGETTYELGVPVNMLPAGRGADDLLLWDVMVNDADGSGREGALEPGTASMQLKHPVGFARWPAYNRRADRVK